MSGWMRKPCPAERENRRSPTRKVPVSYTHLTFHGKALSLVYSIVYNGLYMIPEMVLTAVVGGILAKALAKQLAVNRTNIPVKKEA